VVLGPLDFASFREFLPDRAGFRGLIDLVRLAVDASLEFDVQLVLRGEDVPPLRIGTPDAAAPRLGWSTWLVGAPPGAPVDDAVFEPASARAAALRQAA
jgi:type VI secretion system protein ImpH